MVTNKCKYCHKELLNHLIKLNRLFCNQQCYSSWQKGRIPWNKGLKASKETIEKFKGVNNPMFSKSARKGVKHTLATRRKISKNTKIAMSKSEVIEKLFNIKQHDTYNKKYKYKEIYMRSNWETKVAKWLDARSIKWEYESKNCRFKLSSGRTYIIDFYLPELNKFIEVKGWWDINSVVKYNEAKTMVDICIIDKRNINNINLNIINIKQEVWEGDATC